MWATQLKHQILHNSTWRLYGLHGIMKESDIIKNTMQYKMNGQEGRAFVVVLLLVGVVGAGIAGFYVGKGGGYDEAYAVGQQSGDTAGYLRGKKDGEVIGRSAARTEAEQATANAAAAAVNPFGAANPLGDVTTNPYENVKTNPFE